MRISIHCVFSNSIAHELFQYDPTGNWHGAGTGDDQAYITKVSGSATLKQNRAHNAANEITAISESLGDAWVDPVHDAVGNMTTIPQPASPTNGFTCKWDAWNRLAEVKAGETTVATYRYDGLNRRIKKVTASQTRRYFYSDQWQVIKERVDGASTPERQWVWGLRGVDDVVLRDRDTNDNGILDERLYGVQDALSLTAVVDAGGTVVERCFAYNPLLLGAVQKLKIQDANLERFHGRLRPASRSDAVTVAVRFSARLWLGCALASRRDA